MLKVLQPIQVWWEKLEQKITSLIQKKILEICNNKPVSLEVFEDDYEEMKIQAMKI